MDNIIDQYKRKYRRIELKMKLRDRRLRRGYIEPKDKIWYVLEGLETGRTYIAVDKHIKGKYVSHAIRKIMNILPLNNILLRLDYITTGVVNKMFIVELDKHVDILDVVDIDDTRDIGKELDAKRSTLPSIPVFILI